MENLREQKRVVLDFIKNQKLATLATVNAENNPEAAIVAISETNSLELMFGCFGSTRKYQNLINNTHVALVFSEEKIAVQYEGEAVEIKNDEMKEVQDIHIAKHGGSVKFLDHPEEKYFKIIPSWIRYMDHSLKPHEEFEITF